jgi:hypothetical protein
VSSLFYPWPGRSVAADGHIAPLWGVVCTFLHAHFRELRKAEVQLRRIPIPRTRVHKLRTRHTFISDSSLTLHCKLRSFGKGETAVTDSEPSEERNEQKRRRWHETTLGQLSLSVGGLTLYLLFGIFLWWVLDRYMDPETSTQKKDLLQALGFIMAGVAGAIGIYFTWRGQNLTQRAQEVS